MWSGAVWLARVLVCTPTSRRPPASQPSRACRVMHCCPAPKGPPVFGFPGLTPQLMCVPLPLHFLAPQVTMRRRAAAMADGFAQAVPPQPARCPLAASGPRRTLHRRLQ